MAFKSTILAVTVLVLSSSLNATSFDTTINIGQTLAVTPSDPSQVSQHSATIDIASLVGIPDLFSGAYFINWGYIEFGFNQQAYLAATPEDLLLVDSFSYVQDAKTEQIMVAGEQYNYVVDFRHEDYYFDQRVSAEAVVDIDSVFFSPTYFNYDNTYGFNREEFIVPPGTTGLIERHTHYDSIDRLGDLGSVWFEYFDGYGGNGIFEYTATATNGVLDLDNIYVYLDYQATAVPLPASAWLFGSGLIGLIGIARRKKS